MFSSFWMAGFESACHINTKGHRVDIIAGTQHDAQALQDYRLACSAGMRTVRDGVRWHLIDRGGRYDFSSFLPMLRAANAAGIQVIWNLCHYGWPDDVDVFSPAFVDRFEKFSRAVAHVVREESGEAPFYSPINEISFLSWAAARPCIYPFAEGRDNELKRNFVRVAIASCEAIWQVDRRARFCYPEPVINAVPPLGASGEMIDRARAVTESQYETWDMIAGLREPELGGQRRYLDILGMNYYHSNQWEIDGPRLRWDEEPLDPRWLPFREIIARVWQRYGCPLFVSETSHFGVGRAQWIRIIAEEVRGAMAAGVPVEGICLYPVIDRYDWENHDHWHNSGLWDIHLRDDGTMERVLNPAYAAALEEVQKTVGDDLLVIR